MLGRVARCALSVPEPCAGAVGSLVMSTVVDLMAASDDEDDEIEYVGTLPADEAEVRGD